MEVFNRIQRISSYEAAKELSGFGIGKRIMYRWWKNYLTKATRIQKVRLELHEVKKS